MLFFNRELHSRGSSRYFVVVKVVISDFEKFTVFYRNFVMISIIMDYFIMVVFKHISSCLDMFELVHFRILGFINPKFDFLAYFIMLRHV